MGIRNDIIRRTFSVHDEELVKKMKMHDYDLIVIGAGPAGLFAALTAAEPAGRVLVLEKQPDPGQKLLITGSGQCNFTNTCPLPDFLTAYGDHGRFLKPALYHFTPQQTRDFFQSHGVASEVVPETGKVFPSSRKAQDILHVLLRLCQERGVEIRFNQAVTRLAVSQAHEFQVNTRTDQYITRNVLLATGGKSYPSTGSTGDGYALARTLGHTIVQPRPGLAPFLVKDFALTDLAGTSFQNLAVSLWRGDKKLRSATGALVLTHQGVSGPVVHNLGRYALPGDVLRLCFLTDQNPETLKPAWLAELEQHGSLPCKRWVSRFAPTQALGQKILALIGIDPDSTLALLSRAQRHALFEKLSAFPLEIAALGDFIVAMVTCGGVSLDEVNPKTLESRLMPGLYFAGEVLDIDGDSGGFDLQAAWSTAALAARSLR